MNFSVEDIKTKFPKRQVSATIQCAGKDCYCDNTNTNRKQKKGLGRFSKCERFEVGSWGYQQRCKYEAWRSFLTVLQVWTGASLRDILKWGEWGPSENVQHIQFEGYDLDEKGQPYPTVPRRILMPLDCTKIWSFNTCEYLL